MWMLGGAGLSIVGFVGGGYVAATAGWIAEDDATIVLGGLIIAVGFLVAMFVASRRGARLIHDSIGAITDEPASDVPDSICFGYRRPLRLMAVIVPPYLAALASLPFWAPTGAWVCPVVIGSLGLGCLFGFGPEAAGFTGACIDASGIWLPAAGLRLPWSSIRSVTATPNSIEIIISTSGVAERCGGVPGRWTEQALRKGKRGNPLKAYAPQPELAVWVARRYLRDAVIGPTAG
ncbi:hypothetical protein AB0H43_26765 [Hamadaea sp. NPDC050747]|uniref:hypothetical protein n=1 Tax=Hamadaea sp. NPDC050747 TaxID=3155789 RepID=UPI0033D0507D